MKLYVKIPYVFLVWPVMWAVFTIITVGVCIKALVTVPYYLFKGESHTPPQDDVLEFLSQLRK